MIVYIMICGYPPFYSENPHTQLSRRMKERIMTGRYEFPSEDWSLVSHHAKDFIARFLLLVFVVVVVVVVVVGFCCRCCCCCCCWILCRYPFFSSSSSFFFFSFFSLFSSSFSSFSSSSFSSSFSSSSSSSSFSSSFFSFSSRLLQVDPTERMTIDEALGHSWLLSSPSQLLLPSPAILAKVLPPSMHHHHHCYCG